MDVLETMSSTMDTSIEEGPQEVSRPTAPPPPPPSKTMLSYFTKLPSKAVVVEETNPRKLAPAFNKQHVEMFQNTRLEKFDAELFNVNNNDCNKNGHDEDENGSTDNHTTNRDEPMVDVTRMDVEQHSPKFFVNYIKSIRSGQRKPFKVQVKPRGPLRAKLLQYHEDIRPPYYGTWQRKSRIITGRRPFAQDDDVFDYEVDSEAEWDIGGPGESLKGDDSDDDEELDEYEIDMKTFVPHGYVSDDEVEVHSDQEETPSANQSIDEICDVEDSNLSVQIISEKRPNGSSIEAKQHGHPQQHLPQQPLQQTKQTVCDPSPIQQQLTSTKQKQEIKPISLGIYYDDTQPTILSESKIQFLRAFQGVACKDC
uniref:Chromatin assembly factor 1 subunit A-A n=1 Tax=Aceria tosichella TaxID=561515 RepID=A0A6G1SBV2_9ACAR